jgi:regulator-associated protein of mTOR
MFSALAELSVDPYQEVLINAQMIMDYVMALLLQSPFKRLDCTTLDYPPSPPMDRRILNAGSRSRVGSLQSSPQPSSPVLPRPGLIRTETMTNSISTGVSSTIRRISSFANALKHLAGGIAFPSSEDDRSSPSPGSSFHLRPDLTDLSRPPPNLNVAQYTSPYPRPATP